MTTLDRIDEATIARGAAVQAAVNREDDGCTKCRCATATIGTLCQWCAEEESNGR